MRKRKGGGGAAADSAARDVEKSAAACTVPSEEATSAAAVAADHPRGGEDGSSSVAQTEEAVGGKFNAAVEGTRKDFVKEMLKRGHKAEDLQEYDPRPKRKFHFIHFLANDENRDVLLQFIGFSSAMLVLPVLALFGAMHLAHRMGLSALQCDCLGLLTSLSILLAVAGGFCYRAYKEECRDYPLALKKHQEQKAAFERKQRASSSLSSTSPQEHMPSTEGDDANRLKQS